MTTTTVEARITDLALAAIDREKEARADLAAKLRDFNAAILPADTRSLHEAIADARPWWRLMADAADGGIVQAMLDLRAEYTRALTRPSYGSSTNLVDTLVSDLERGGLCKFLEATRRIAADLA